MQLLNILRLSIHLIQMRWIWRIAATLVLIAVLTLLVLRRPEVPIVAKQVAFPLPLTNLYTILWLAPHQLLVGTSEQFWYQATADGDWQPLILPPDPQCLRVYYDHLVFLPDGRLGMAKTCTAHMDQSTGHDFTVSLVSYDWQTHQVDPLISVTLPDTGEFTWQPSQQRGVFTPIGSYSTLYWLAPDRVDPIPIRLHKGSRSWYLPDSVTVLDKYMADPGKVGRMPQQVGMARDPAWSPAGERIAFWATLETIGQSDPFPVVRWDIYLLDPNTLTTERLLSDVMDPAQLAWSPDGRWLAYRAGADLWKPRGIWLYSLDQRRTYLVQPGHFIDLAWSPDGQSLAATQCQDDLCKTFQIWQYDVHALTMAAS